jgi:ankyrin repeat protein
LSNHRYAEDVALFEELVSEVPGVSPGAAAKLRQGLSSLLTDNALRPFFPAAGTGCAVTLAAAAAQKRMLPELRSWAQALKLLDDASFVVALGAAATVPTDLCDLDAAQLAHLRAQIGATIVGGNIAELGRDRFDAALSDMRAFYPGLGHPDSANLTGAPRMSPAQAALTAVTAVWAHRASLYHLQADDPSEAFLTQLGRCVLTPADLCDLNPLEVTYCLRSRLGTGDSGGRNQRRFDEALAKLREEHGGMGHPDPAKRTNADGLRLSEGEKEVLEAHAVRKHQAAMESGAAAKAPRTELPTSAELEARREEQRRVLAEAGIPGVHLPNAVAVVEAMGVEDWRASSRRMLAEARHPRLFSGLLFESAQRPFLVGLAVPTDCDTHHGLTPPRVIEAAAAVEKQGPHSLHSAASADDQIQPPHHPLLRYTTASAPGSAEDKFMARVCREAAAAGFGLGGPRDRTGEGEEAVAWNDRWVPEQPSEGGGDGGKVSSVVALLHALHPAFALPWGELQPGGAAYGAGNAAAGPRAGNGGTLAGDIVRAGYDTVWSLYAMTGLQQSTLMRAVGLKPGAAAKAEAMATAAVATASTPGGVEHEGEAVEVPEYLLVGVEADAARARGATGGMVGEAVRLLGRHVEKLLFARQRLFSHIAEAKRAWAWAAVAAAPAQQLAPRGWRNDTRALEALYAARPHAENPSGQPGSAMASARLRASYAAAARLCPALAQNGLALELLAATDTPPPSPYAAAAACDGYVEAYIDSQGGAPGHSGMVGSADGQKWPAVHGSFLPGGGSGGGGTGGDRTKEDTSGSAPSADAAHAGGASVAHIMLDRGERNTSPRSASSAGSPRGERHEQLLAAQRRRLVLREGASATDDEAAREAFAHTGPEAAAAHAVAAVAALVAFDAADTANKPRYAALQAKTLAARSAAAAVPVPLAYVSRVEDLGPAAARYHAEAEAVAADMEATERDNAAEDAAMEVESRKHASADEVVAAKARDAAVQCEMRARERECTLSLVLSALLFWRNEPQLAAPEVSRRMVMRRRLGQQVSEALAETLRQGGESCAVAAAAATTYNAELKAFTSVASPTLDAKSITQHARNLSSSLWSAVGWKRMPQQVQRWAHPWAQPPHSLHPLFTRPWLGEDWARGADDPGSEDDEVDDGTSERWTEINQALAKAGLANVSAASAAAAAAEGDGVLSDVLSKEGIVMADPNYVRMMTATTDKDRGRDDRGRSEAMGCLRARYRGREAAKARRAAEAVLTEAGQVGTAAAEDAWPGGLRGNELNQRELDKMPRPNGSKSLDTLWWQAAEAIEDVAEAEQTFITCCDGDRYGGGGGGGGGGRGGEGGYPADHATKVCMSGCAATCAALADAHPLKAAAGCVRAPLPATDDSVAGGDGAAAAAATAAAAGAAAAAAAAAAPLNDPSDPASWDGIYRAFRRGVTDWRARTDPQWSSSSSTWHPEVREPPHPGPGAADPLVTENAAGAASSPARLHATAEVSRRRRMPAPVLDAQMHFLRGMSEQHAAYRAGERVCPTDDGPRAGEVGAHEGGRGRSMPLPPLAELQLLGKRQTQDAADFKLSGAMGSPLYVAVTQGRVAALPLLLSLGGGGDNDGPCEVAAAADANGRTALHHAALYGQAACCSVLCRVLTQFEKGPLLVADRHGRSALHLAAMEGDADTVYVLLEVRVGWNGKSERLGRMNDGDPAPPPSPARARMRRFCSPTGSAALTTTAAAPLVYLPPAPPPSSSAQAAEDEADSLTTPHKASIEDFINAPDSGTHTPLSLAASAGAVDAIDLLIDRGAAIELPTPQQVADAEAEFAARAAHAEGAYTLAPAALAGDGYSPLMSAAMAGSTKGVYALLRRGARRDAVAHDGMTALLLAVLKEQIATITALVHAGASLFKKVRRRTKLRSNEVVEVVPTAVVGGGGCPALASQRRRSGGAPERRAPDAGCCLCAAAHATPPPPSLPTI